MPANLPEFPNIEWEYSMQAVTEDKRNSRVGVTPPLAYELIGVDGSTGGGVRPFPGFKKVHDFDPTNERNNPLTFNGGTTLALTTAGPGSTSIHNFAAASPFSYAGYAVDRFWPVVFRISSSTYGYGFVYRLRTNSGAFDYLMIDYRIGTSSTVYTRELYGTLTGSSWGEPPRPSNDLQVDVAVNARLVYILVEGRTPMLFWVDDGGLGVGYREHYVGPSTYPYSATPSATGPGLAPVLIEPNRAGAINTVAAPPAGADSSGQVILDVAFPAAATWVGGTYPAGITDAHALDAGTYSFAYQLYDSRTGRRGALSTVAPCSNDNFHFFNKYGILEIQYDAAKWDYCYVYRSARVEGAGGTFIAAVLYQDNFIQLSTVASAVAGTGGYTRAVMVYQQADPSLVFSDIYLDKTTFERTPPTAGAGTFYENIILYGKIQRPSTSTSPTRDGVGEMRWSSMMEVNAELVPPNSRYAPKVPTAEVLRFVTLGPNAIGFGRERLFHIRKESLYIKVQEMHEGFGIVGARNVAVVGPYAYFLTTKGLKTVDSGGQLEDVRSLNELVIETWAGDLAGCFAAFDPLVSVLFLLNPTKKTAACLWFNTAQATELYDMNFTCAEKGWWPLTPTDFTTQLTERALFLQTVGTGSTGKYRLYLMDSTRSRTISGSATSAFNGETRNTMLDIVGDSRAYVFSVDITGRIITTTEGNITGSQRAEGGYVYNLNPNSASYGQKWTIVSTGVNTITVAETIQLGELWPGDRIGISPVYFRWVGHPVDLRTETGQPFGGQTFFTGKHLSTLGASFTDVQGPAVEDSEEDASFRALAYRGNESTPAAYGVPQSRAGEQIANITENESIHYAAYGPLPQANGVQPVDPVITKVGKFGIMGTCLTPGLEIFVPDLDFRLQSVRALGKVLGTARGTLPS